MSSLSAVTSSIFHLQANVEGLCTGLVAEQADATEAAQLVEINAEFGRLVWRGANGDKDATDYRAINFAFHSQVVALAKSAVLTKHTEVLWPVAISILAPL